MELVSSKDPNLDTFGIKTLPNFSIGNGTSAQNLLKEQTRAIISDERAPNLPALYKTLMDSQFGCYQTDIHSSEIHQYIANFCGYLINYQIVPNQLIADVKDMSRFFIKMADFLIKVKSPDYFAFELLTYQATDKFGSVHFDSIFNKDSTQLFQNGDQSKIKIVCTLDGDCATMFTPVSNIFGDLASLRRESEKHPESNSKVYLTDQNNFFEFPLHQPILWQGGFDGIPHFTPKTNGRLFFGLQAW